MLALRQETFGTTTSCCSAYGKIDGGKFARDIADEVPRQKYVDIELTSIRHRRLSEHKYDTSAILRLHCI